MGKYKISLYIFLHFIKTIIDSLTCVLSTQINVRTHVNTCVCIKITEKKYNQQKTNFAVTPFFSHDSKTS